MAIDDLDLSDFEFDGNQVLGSVSVPWLNGSVNVLITSDDGSVSELQKAILARFIEMPRESKERLEQLIFTYYEANVFDPSLHDERTPEVKHPSEIWRLLSEPAVLIPLDHQVNKKRQFSVLFECTWDGEHGIGIVYDSNLHPLEVGGQMDFF